MQKGGVHMYTKAPLKNYKNYFIFIQTFFKACSVKIMKKQFYCRKINFPSTRMHIPIHIHMNMGMPNCSLLLIEYDTQFICRKKDEQKVWSEFLMKIKTIIATQSATYPQYAITLHLNL